MSNIHFILQGKGGVGKSYISSLLLQFLNEKDKTAKGIDTDPVNQSFFAYKALEVSVLKIVEDSVVAPRKFDDLIETLITSECDYVIDNGASTFIPLTFYMKENNVYEILSDAKKNVYIHSVITGGQALHDTLIGLSGVCKQSPNNVKLVLWLNEYFGKIEVDGKSIEDMRIYKENKERIAYIVKIPKQSENTFALDVQYMLMNKMTFNEIAQSNQRIMVKSRLHNVKLNIFNQIELIPGI